MTVQESNENTNNTAITAMGIGSVLLTISPEINLRYDADPVFRNQPVAFLVPTYIVSDLRPIKQKMSKCLRPGMFQAIERLTPLIIQ